MSQKSVGIIYKHHHEPARTEALKLEDWFKKRGIKVFSEEMTAEVPQESSSPREPVVPKDVDWIVVLGGDGTLLGAARQVGKYGAPILGVNLGGLGFLTCIPLERLHAAVETMVNGGLQVESRMMLETSVLRDEKEVIRFQVLNDVVINKSTLARIIDLDVAVNDVFVTTFRADGLIISTPTGSTAYNLSAGGPILYPTIETFVLTPICPFTLTNRPIIVPDSAVVGIELGRESEETVVITFDGQVGFELHHGDKINIYKSKEKINLFKPPDQDHFRILRTKLRWGGVTYNNKDTEPS
jgi:NAD+ kinase